MRALLLAWLAACGPQDESDCVHSFYADADGDGHGVPDATVTGCTAPPGYETTHDDCDDRNSAIHPGVDELCNGTDDDCDGEADPFDPWYVDLDRDGYGYEDETSCGIPTSPTAPIGGDCDDSAAAVHPDAEEICNGIDDDCEGTVDIDAVDASTLYTDADGDGYGDDATAYAWCELPAGSLTPIGGDCDDDLAWVNPSATEVCDELDNDCDTLVDFDDPDLPTPPQYADDDEDGFGDPTTATNSCTSIPGWVLDATDCDDAASAVNLDADETCNTNDDDCDGLTDDDDPSVTGRRLFYPDDDGDGLGTLPSVMRCDAPTGYADTHGDCDDSDAGIGLPTTRYRDVDGDGYGGYADDRCATVGWILTGGDCDDSESDVFPGAAEICNDVDDNCDGLTDDDDPFVEWPTFYADADADGHGDAGTNTVGTSCDPPSGYVARHDDCNDDDAWIHPQATEYCDDGVDNDCDDIADDDAVYTFWYADDDADGYGDDTDEVSTCEREVPDRVLRGGDCDDDAPAIHPGAEEICVTETDDDCHHATDACRIGVDDVGFSLVGPTVLTEVSTLGYEVLATDLNADGVADLVAAGPDIDPPVYVLFGPQSGESTLGDADVTFESAEGSELGDAIGVGDADLDGDADLLLGAPGDHSAYLFLGPVTASGDATTADASFAVSDRGPSATVVKIVPDYDGDRNGMPEVAVNSLDDTAGAREGEVFLAPATTRRSLSRLRTDATYTYEGDANYELGSSIVAIGDTTGDGIGDLALGAPGRGAYDVFVVAGGEAAGSYAITDAAIATLSSVRPDRFGSSIDAADSDLDGYVDLFVGAPIAGAAVYAFRGPFDGARDANAADARWEGDPAMGFSVAADGDVDADGFPDVLIGGCVVGGAWGVAYLDFGPAEGVVDAAELISFGADLGTVTGYSLGFVPDWTGDGGSEVALGAPYVVGPSSPSGESHAYVLFSENLY